MELWNIYVETKDGVLRSRRIYVYGSMGYGKSHMLAALACLLVKQNERVIYFPDCRSMLESPLR